MRAQEEMANSTLHHHSRHIWVYMEHFTLVDLFCPHNRVRGWYHYLPCKTEKTKVHRDTILEKEMATHSSVLTWRIPGMGAWWDAVCGVAQSRTRLKRLSSSSSLSYNWPTTLKEAERTKQRLNSQNRHELWFTWVMLLRKSSFLRQIRF